ncbi:MAG: proline racemase family protein [Candidatus Geothermarchaeales archaeon]
MTFRKIISAVDAHTAGEPVRIIQGNGLGIKGDTLAEKKDYLKTNMDYIRTSLMLEPRGHRDMFGAVLVEPQSKEAALGVIFMDASGYLDMCGHGTMGVATVAIETGLIESKKTILIDTPAGIVTARPEVKGSRVVNVTIRNVPSFLYEKRILEVEGVGSLPVEISFGGNFFALVEARDLSLSVKKQRLQEIISTGLRVKEAANKHVEVHHPFLDINSIDLVEISDKPINPEADDRNVVVFGEGLVDRSPCGTGTCAKMAVLYAGGRLSLNERFVHESIIGTTFTGKVVSETRVDRFKAVVPEITGSSFITDIHHLIIEPDDPLKHGFILR